MAFVPPLDPKVSILAWELWLKVEGKVINQCFMSTCTADILPPSVNCSWVLPHPPLPDPTVSKRPCAAENKQKLDSAENQTLGSLGKLVGLTHLGSQ